MLDLGKVKVVLFDFDDTLCIHFKHEDTEGYLREMVLGNCEWWDVIGCKKNECMQIFIGKCLDAHLRMGLISATAVSCTAINKINWVKNTYGVEMENFCVGKIKDKASIVKALLDTGEYRPEEVLVVDDTVRVLEDVTRLGCQAANPMEVVNLVEECTGWLSNWDGILESK